MDARCNTQGAPRATVRLRGLYAITHSEHAGSKHVVESVGRALAGGASLVQYRDKGSDHGRRLRLARALVALCRERNVPLIVNDDVELARQSGADGVHLGRDDAAPARARAALGAGALIGISCYDSLERALQAEAQGADYVAFGSFFASPIKPAAVRADAVLLGQARRRLAIPIAAIGGITPDNGAGLVAAGADMLAVITGVFGQPDIAGAARRYARLFR